MRRRIGIRVMLAMLVGVLLIAGGWVWTSFRREMDGKKVYSTLQFLEFDNRERQLALPYASRGQDGLAVLALTSGKPVSPYVWIALEIANPDEADGVFRVPASAPVVVRCDQARAVVAKPGIDPAVRAFLLGVCKS